MPWKVEPVSQIRLAFVHQVLTLNVPVAAACRMFSISRKTGYKWLHRFRSDPGACLVDCSRRPKRSPRQTPSDLEALIVAARDQHRWGPRKLHKLLSMRGVTLPSMRTVANILSRHQRIPSPTKPPGKPVHFFERPEPNDLWQCDFKSALEVERQRICPFVVLDDYSRFLVALHPCLDMTMRSAWTVLWNAFDEFGLPRSILCDNAFGSSVPHIPSISWFESQLIRLDIRPIHGRPHHPQTQGKVERLNGTLAREVLPRIGRDSLTQFHADLSHWRAHVYNTLRPHEALGDLPPISRWYPSPRPRPKLLPEISYPTGAIVRKVSSIGIVGWKNCRILIGRGLVGQFVRIEERDSDVAVFYSWKEVRAVPLSMLRRDIVL